MKALIFTSIFLFTGSLFSKNLADFNLSELDSLQDQTSCINYMTKKLDAPGNIDLLGITCTNLFNSELGVANLISFLNWFTNYDEDEFAKYSLRFIITEGIMKTYNDELSPNENEQLQGALGEESPSTPDIYKKGIVAQ